MAQSLVFIPYDKPPFYQAVMVNVEWNDGLSKIQKQKNIKAIHGTFAITSPGKKVLEISSKSMQEHGKALSAFFLLKYISSLNKQISVECIYQSAKTFENGGPYIDLLTVTSKEAKKDERLQNSGRLVSYVFEGKEFPLEPETVFYNYIYINALLENENLAQVILEYDAFTDIEFNPETGRNCQAKAAATFVALSKLGLIEQIKDFESFLKLNKCSL